MLVSSFPMLCYSLMCSLKNQWSHSELTQVSLFSCAQACWRGYRQRRAYLERLHYLKSNAEAAIKVWKILSSAFVPMLGIVACL